MIGAALSGGFRSSLGTAGSEINRLSDRSMHLGESLNVADRQMRSLSGGAENLQGHLMQVGQAIGSLMIIRNAITMAGDLQHRLAATGITADLTAAQVTELRNRLRLLSVPDATNQSVDELERGFNKLVSAGMDSGKAQDALYGIGRTATATQASIEDLSDTSYVLIETLGVAPDALTAELDRLAYAGGRGAFELKDMAKYFPMLGAGAKALKLQGSEAVGTLGAALQIAKRGAADPGEAANNMANFMRALSSPETLKNARQAGINIKGIIRKAWAEGRNPLEDVLEAVKAKTKGDPFKIGQIFRDAQVQNFLKPVLADLDELKALKNDIMTKSTGTVDRQYVIMMDQFNEKTKAFDSSLTKLGDSLGRSFLAPLGAVVSILTPFIGFLADAADASPVFTFTLVTLGAALTVLPPAIMLVGAALRVMGGAMMANPIMAGIALIGLGAAYLIDHWDAVADFFKGIWEPVRPYWEKWFGWIGAAWDKMSPIFETVGKWFGIGEEAPAAAAAAQKSAPRMGDALQGSPTASAGQKSPRMGAGINAAEKRGASLTARSGQQESSSGRTMRHFIELTVRGLPAGSSLVARSDSSDVTINARTGPLMAGAN
jgi:TP901 family phage tail tape measure protein